MNIGSIIQNNKMKKKLFCLILCINNIRNNWINQNDFDKTFKFSNFENHSIIERALFSDIRKVYNMEVNQITKTTLEFVNFKGKLTRKIDDWI